MSDWEGGGCLTKHEGAAGGGYNTTTSRMIELEERNAALVQELKELRVWLAAAACTSPVIGSDDSEPKNEGPVYVDCTDCHTATQGGAYDAATGRFRAAKGTVSVRGQLRQLQARQVPSSARLAQLKGIVLEDFLHCVTSIVNEPHADLEKGIREENTERPDSHVMFSTGNNCLTTYPALEYELVSSVGSMSRRKCHHHRLTPFLFVTHLPWWLIEL
jgi:hypothetical protein